MTLILGIFRRSWPLILHALLGLVIFNSDFFFLRFFRDSASVVKAVSWRVLGTGATVALALVFTRHLALSLAVGGVEFLSKSGLFWLHERVWDRLRVGKQEIPPSVAWFTGLSGSGKSTLAGWVAHELRTRGFRVECLDGDAVRKIFPLTGFTRPEREEHIRRVGFLASKLEQHGVFVVASFVSPYAESRQFVRELCQDARARRGEIQHFTGIDDPLEPPAGPEITLDTSTMPVAEAGGRVLTHLERRGRGR